MKMIDVVVITGSPRALGNTNAATSAFLKELLRLESLTIKSFNLSELNIGHCRGCNACQKNGGECVIIDDMVSIYESINHCDITVMATPIYFSGPSSYMKQMIDRCQCIWMRESEMRTDSLGIMIAVSGQKEANFKNTASIIKSFFKTIGSVWAGDLIFPGYDECGELEADENAIKKVKEFAHATHQKIKDIRNPKMDG